ncbi:MAG TPA: protein kinase [Gemmatimonadaceae bacterium]|nr:protein kinase [Gemmatimonadaceae bacterium]
MNDPRWQRVQDLFWSTRELPADARDERLRLECGDDTELLEEVRRMLAADAGEGILDHTASVTPLADRLADTPMHDRVGPYVVTEEIGRGGMGVVYRAHDPRLRRDVALKFLPAAWTKDRNAKSRFINEARAASALDHPHNCPVYDIGSTEDGRLYIAMAYCAGGSLASRLASGPLSIADAVRIATEVAGALERAHEAGIVHRDVKPANIAFTERGEARVLDFGVAVLGEDEWAAPRISAGTPSYMAPEQVRGGAVDRRTDVWALGAVLFEMLTGRRAFPGTNADATHAIVHDAPPDVRTLRPDVSADIASVVRRALEREPERRFATTAEMAAALRSASDGAGRAEAGRWRRWRFGAIAAGGALLAIAGFALSRAGGPEGASRGLDAAAVAILPFRVSGEPSIAYLREGMVDLLAAKLTGEGGLRAVDPRAVYVSWQRVAGSDTVDLPIDAARALAGRVGAGNVLLGEVVGTVANLIVNASITDSRGTEVARATAQGAHTDLASLVDQLVAQLLTASAGEEPQGLSALTTRSLPALRAYLEGQAAYRRGRYGEALERYGRALDLDSTFALAGLGLTIADGWVGTGHARQRGRAVAWQWRDRMSPRDRALLFAQVGQHYPRPPTAHEQLVATEEALRLAPDRVELWQSLGDYYLHYGRMGGVEAWEAYAERAFRRALESDSAFSSAMHHLTILYARQGRRDELRRLVDATRQYVPEGATADFVRWRAGLALGTGSIDSVALDSMATEAIGWIGMISQDDGVDVPLGEHALRLRVARPGTRGERLERQLSVHMLALNGGHPEAAAALADATRDGQPDSSFFLRLRVLDALFGDGDRASGAEAAAALGSATDTVAARLNACVRHLWQAVDTLGMRDVPAGTGLPRPESGNASIYEQLCETGVAALRASQRHDASARRAVGRLDDLYRAGPLEFYPGDGHVEYVPILTARVLEAHGDPAAALAALQRRPYFIGWNPYLAAGLRYEGRLAAAIGDRDGAVRAYKHYLALRYAASPELRAVTDSVRDELRRLEAR